jgi:hypothetical protein
MNQNNLYLTMIALPALITMLVLIIGIAVVVLTDSDKLLERIAKALSTMLIVVGLYETVIITYVSIIKLIK